MDPIQFAQLTQFLGLGIIGAAMSAYLQYAKKKAGLSSPESKLYAILGSIILGVTYWGINQNVELYQAVLGVLTAASTVYALFFSGKDVEPVEPQQ